MMCQNLLIIFHYIQIVVSDLILDFFPVCIIFWRNKDIVLYCIVQDA